MKYVIIGNSAAAIGCIEGIRSVDSEGSITVISKETQHTYSRPLISYLLLGKTDLERMKYRPNSFYEDKNCKVMFGTTVKKILPNEKEMLLDNGESVKYDKLLVATGSNPFVPPIEGVSSAKSVHTFMSLDDALALKKDLTSESRVIILGGGLIGLKCAEGILNSVKKITVIDMADRILPSILDSEGSSIIQKHLENKGVEFLLGNSITKIDGQKALLKSGEEIEFDNLVIAVGVRANTSLVSEAGGKVNRGIYTDLYCCTDLPDVFAAGDCSESYDITIEQVRVLALLPNAYMQGEVAGINMAGGKTLYDHAIPMNAIGFFGLHIISAGSYEGECYTDVKGNNYKKLFYKDNRLMGYILIGDVARAGIYTSLIREKTPLDSIDFELIKDKPQLMAFTQKDRAALLIKEALH
ncbi:MAG: pyridine nucleotide-disulfide oxidoreductase [Clostridiales bacterium GWF2_36_10]|nr:MAG: pyridine nucleotide-disulfide oxidoreductase [Clostridiales bacterium GWF2_36_10]HAN21397.1 NAD(P)/FAD-dependent oxidoreductase [Clostridiales bacterium]